MYVFITLTSAGADAGPFNLYSNVDGFVSAFATGVSKAALLAGYSVIAPAGTTTVRIMSSGVCTNYIDVVIGATTTTTTTTGAPTLEKMVLSSAANICGSTVVWTSKTPSEVKCDWYEGYDPLVLVQGVDAYYYSNVGFVIGAQLYTSSGIPLTFTGNYVQSPNSPLSNPNPFTTPPINVVTISSGVVSAFYDISSLPACAPYVCPTTTTTTTVV